MHSKISCWKVAVPCTLGHKHNSKYRHRASVTHMVSKRVQLQTNRHNLSNSNLSRKANVAKWKNQCIFHNNSTNQMKKYIINQQNPCNYQIICQLMSHNKQARLIKLLAIMNQN